MSRTLHVSVIEELDGRFSSTSLETNYEIAHIIVLLITSFRFSLLVYQTHWFYSLDVLEEANEYKQKSLEQKSWTPKT